MKYSTLATAAALSTLALPAAADLTQVQFNTAGTELLSATLNGQVFGETDFITGELTAVTDSNIGLVLPDGAAIPADVSSVLDDGISLQSGLRNVDSFTFRFDVGIRETTGLNEIVLFDNDQGAVGSFSGLLLPERFAESIDVTINGQTNRYTSPASEINSFFLFDMDNYANAGPVSTPAGLDGLNYGSPVGLNVGEINALSFNLADFGLLEGQTIREITVTSVGNGIDPTTLIAIPEPASVALVALGGAAMLRRNRRAA